MKKKLLILLVLLVVVSFFLDSYVADLMLQIESSLLDSIMLWFSNLITVFFVLIVITSFFMYEERKTSYILVLGASFVAGFVVAYLFKFLIMRPRPLGVTFHDILIFGFLLKLPDYAFPSAHATTAFSVLPVLDKEFKKLKPLWIFVAVMIAVSRIYLKEHFLSDVVAGSVLGYLLGYLILKVEEKHGLAKRFLQKV